MVVEFHLIQQNHEHLEQLKIKDGFKSGACEKEDYYFSLVEADTNHQSHSSLKLECILKLLFSVFRESELRKT